MQFPRQVDPYNKEISLSTAIELTVLITSQSAALLFRTYSKQSTAEELTSGYY
jgi:hypothetical protein